MSTVVATIFLTASAPVRTIALTTTTQPRINTIYISRALAPTGAVPLSNEGFAVTVKNALKTFDANTATADQLIDVVATLLQTLKTKQVI